MEHNRRVLSVARRLGHRTFAALYDDFAADSPRAVTPQVYNEGPGFEPRRRLLEWLQRRLADRNLGSTNSAYLYPFDPNVRSSDRTPELAQRIHRAFDGVPTGCVVVPCSEHVGFFPHLVPGAVVGAWQEVEWWTASVAGCRSPGRLERARLVGPPGADSPDDPTLLGGLLVADRSGRKTPLRLCLVGVDSPKEMQLVEQALDGAPVRRSLQLVVVGPAGRAPDGLVEVPLRGGWVRRLLRTIGGARAGFPGQATQGCHLRVAPDVIEMLASLARRSALDSRPLPYVINYLLAHFPRPEAIADLSDAQLAERLRTLVPDARLSLAADVASAYGRLGEVDTDQLAVLRCLAADRGDTVDVVLSEATGLTAGEIRRALRGLKPVLVPTTPYPAFWLEGLAQSIRADGWLGEPASGAAIHARCAQTYQRLLKDPRALHEAAVVQSAVWHGLHGQRAQAEQACELFVCADTIEQDLGETEARRLLLHAVREAAPDSPLPEIGALADHLLATATRDSADALLSIPPQSWPFPLDAYLERAKAHSHFVNSRFEEALQAAEQLRNHLQTNHLAGPPAHARVARFLAVLAADLAASAARRLGRLKEAKRLSEEAIQLAADWLAEFEPVAPWVALLAILLRSRQEGGLKDMGDLRGAAREVRRALEGIESFRGGDRGWGAIVAAGLRSEQADVARHLGDWHSCRALPGIARELESLCRRDPHGEVARRELITARRRTGVYYAHIGEYELAERAYRAALALVPSDWARREPDDEDTPLPEITQRNEGLVVMSLGLVWQRQRRAGAALDCFAACARYFHTWDNAYSVILAQHRAGAALRDLGLFDQAREHQEGALEALRRAYPEARFRQIEVLRKLIVTLLVSGRPAWRTDATAYREQLLQAADQPPPLPYHKAAAFLRFAEEEAKVRLVSEAWEDLLLVEGQCPALIRRNPELKSRHLFLKAQLADRQAQSTIPQRMRWALQAAEAAMDWGNRRRAREAFACAVVWASQCPGASQVLRLAARGLRDRRLRRLVDEAETRLDEPAAALPGDGLAYWASRLPLARFGEVETDLEP
jgi:tetratricopeptide (TPR) repeat protein